MSNTVSSGAICTVVAFKAPGVGLTGRPAVVASGLESAEIAPDDGVAGCAELQRKEMDPDELSGQSIAVDLYCRGLGCSGVQRHRSHFGPAGAGFCRDTEGTS